MLKLPPLSVIDLIIPSQFVRYLAALQFNRFQFVQVLSHIKTFFDFFGFFFLGGLGLVFGFSTLSN